uniref:Cytochrome c biogenesis protein CcsA n=1 Tax=Hariotina reticulata TaxID=183314 RepID=A0A2R4PAQ0_9CHLO|nr:heme attachment to plastid cytochrome c protein [Hariotina reticulata]
MNIDKIENFFANSSFFFLLVSMICYWIQVAFERNFNFGRLNMICANLCIFVLLILRWKESGHFPLSNLYESLMFLSWNLSTFHLFLENVNTPNDSNNISGSKQINMDTNLQNMFFLNFQNQKGQTQISQKNTQSFFGAFTSPTALFINAFATLSLPAEMQHSAALVPALQSNWLMMHVTVMILSYSALICGSLLSIAFLILTRNMDMDTQLENTNSPLFNNTFAISPNTLVLSSSVGEELASNNEFSSKEQKQFLESESWLSKQNLQKKVDSFIPTKTKFIENLDNLSYRILGIGFPFLTIGILSGAVWANEAWGSYWSWDPKETWALATWFVFAIYLHTRITKGWRGKKPAIIASLGFVFVWICFLGVNLLGEGLHSYGFFKS